MAVTPAYREWVLEQLRDFGPVTVRSMFGGAGLHRDGTYFALIAGDVLYFRTDDLNRPEYEAAGARVFQPMGEGTATMPYHEVPAEVVEDPERLCEWASRALEAARRKGRKKSR